MFDGIENACTLVDLKLINRPAENYGVFHFKLDGATGANLLSISVYYKLFPDSSRKVTNAIDSHV